MPLVRCASSHHQAAGGARAGVVPRQPSGRSIPLPILVVEDDPAICTVLCELLEDAGHRPTLAATAGREALTVLRTVPQPLVVLLVLGLPRLDGAGVSVAWPVAPVRRRQQPRPVSVLVTGRDETAAPDRVTPDVAEQIQIVHTPVDLDSRLAVVAQAARRLPQPAATQHQRLRHA
jgi:CheY-like chemotaxis protein